MQSTTEEQSKTVPPEIVELPAKVGTAIGKEVESAGHDVVKATETAGTDTSEVVEQPDLATEQAVSPTPAPMKSPSTPPTPAAVASAT
ncbi:MAG: hypothetical protein WA688_10065 [Thermoplasmata archaeon]